MDFTIPEELTALRTSFATFLDREVRPIEESVLADLTGLDPDRGRVQDAVADDPPALGRGWLLRLPPARGGRRLGTSRPSG